MHAQLLHAQRPGQMRVRPCDLEGTGTLLFPLSHFDVQRPHVHQCAYPLDARSIHIILVFWSLLTGKCGRENVDNLVIRTFAAELCCTSRWSRCTGCGTRYSCSKAGLLVRVQIAAVRPTRSPKSCRPRVCSSVLICARCSPCASIHEHSHWRGQQLAPGGKQRM
jgi:hypothetical protein